MEATTKCRCERHITLPRSWQLMRHGSVWPTDACGPGVSRPVSVSGDRSYNEQSPVVSLVVRPVQSEPTRIRGGAAEIYLRYSTSHTSNDRNQTLEWDENAKKHNCKRLGLLVLCSRNSGSAIPQEEHPHDAEVIVHLRVLPFHKSCDVTD